VHCRSRGRRYSGRHAGRDAVGEREDQPGD
jgi:hypothetical protein